MPYSTEWVTPETFLTHKGVTVYHLYKDDDIAQGPRTYSFTTNILGSDENPVGGEFDIRDLSIAGGDNWIRDTIINAIDRGIITPWVDEEDDA